MWVGARFQRYIDQLAVNAIRPAVIRTGKGASVAAICITHTHGPVAALVEKRLNAAVFLTHYDNRIFPHVGVKEITRFWDLAFVGEK